MPHSVGIPWEITVHVPPPEYYKDDLNRLRSWISLTATQGGAAREDGNEGKTGGEGEEMTEIEALRTFAESVKCKGDILKAS